MADATAVDRVVRTIARVALDNEERYGRLDAEAGDGDFGYVLAGGWRRVLDLLDEQQPSSPGEYLMTVARGFTRVGGTTGPVWGTAFLRAAKMLGDGTEVDAEQLVAMLRAAATGISERGGAEVGDKTLLDALVPATDALEHALHEGASLADALRAATDAARTGADGTRELQARRGRATYQGEASKGPVDPGAAAVADIFAAVADIADTADTADLA